MVLPTSIDMLVLILDHFVIKIVLLGIGILEKNNPRCFATPATVLVLGHCFDYVVDGLRLCFDNVVDGMRHCLL